MAQPTPLTIPACMMDAYKLIFPTLDFDRIAFFRGLPPLITSANGFTMSSGGWGRDIRIYIDDDEDFEVCSDKPRMFLLIAHELVHALQVQGMAGGGHIPGSWTTFYTSHAFGCSWRGDKCRNELEKEAYLFANGGECGEGKLKQFLKHNFNDGSESRPPCHCHDGWPRERDIGGVTLVDLLTKNTDMSMRESKVGMTLCWLLNWPITVILGALAAFGFSSWGGAIGAIVGGVLGLLTGGLLGAITLGLLGGLAGWAIEKIGGWIGGMFDGPSNAIWFTAYNLVEWVVPDIPVTRADRIKTSKSPAIAELNGRLHAVYRGGDSSDIWYTWFEGGKWQAEDWKISKNGHTKTSEAPALAAYRGELYMAYKAPDSTIINYNVFNGAWQAIDTQISQGAYTRTSKAPALAEYNGKLYMAYRSGQDSKIYYNVFDGNAWWAKDKCISQNGRTLTSDGPSLASFNGKLYMAYRSAQNDQIYFNFFDGASWLAVDKIVSGGQAKTSRSPALFAFNNTLYLAYRASNNADIWYTTFDGVNWGQNRKITKNGAIQTGRSPALAFHGGYLFMVYRDNS